MGSLKLLGIVFFYLAIDNSHQDINCDDHKYENCKTDKNLAVITCTRHLDEATTTTGLCECSDGDQGATCGKITAIDTTEFGGVDLAKCIEWCTNLVDSDAANEATNCKFWKFVHPSSYQTTCYLMNKDGCMEEATDKCDHSTSDHDDKPHCQSGLVETPPLCQTDTGTTTQAPSTTCPGPIEDHDASDTTKFYQKWTCVQPDGAGSKGIDMYAVDAMPVGGYCELIIEHKTGSCKKLDPNVRYECNGNGWEKSSTEMDDITLTGDDRLEDQECHAPDLTGVEDEEGRYISCQNGGLNGGTIPAENRCLMTCDGYSVLSVFTDWKTNGEGRSWFYTISGTTEQTELSDGSILKCWGRR